MKVHLVTGATGFVGRHLIPALLRSGDSVWVLVRPQATASAEARATSIFGSALAKFPSKFRVVEGDVRKVNLGIAKSTLSELQKHEVVIWHLAANLSFLPKDQQDVVATNYRGTVNVVTLANKVAAQLMHMSTAYVCGNAASLNEDELYKGQTFRNQYEQTKFKAESYVHSKCQVPYIVFRPSIIIGDAYHGKAAGCTFGYYRYMFMFHFLKKRIVKTLGRKTLLSFVLKKLGSSYDVKRDALTVPWLVIPYPRRTLVDMVTVDHVVRSMVSLYKDAQRNITVHLTHNRLPRLSFLFGAVLQDLGYRKVKLIPVPAWAFRALLQILHFVAVPIRKYVRSVMWYTPYFTKRGQFENRLAEHGLKAPPLISRTLASKINLYAKKKILDFIEV